MTPSPPCRFAFCRSCSAYSTGTAPVAAPCMHGPRSFGGVKTAPPDSFYYPHRTSARATENISLLANAMPTASSPRGRRSRDAGSSGTSRPPSSACRPSTRYPRASPLCIRTKGISSHPSRSPRKHSDGRKDRRRDDEEQEHRLQVRHSNHALIASSLVPFPRVPAHSPSPTGSCQPSSCTWA